MFNADFTLRVEVDVAAETITVSVPGDAVFDSRMAAMKYLTESIAVDLAGKTKDGTLLVVMGN